MHDRRDLLELTQLLLKLELELLGINTLCLRDEDALLEQLRLETKSFARATENVALLFQLQYTRL